RHSRAGQALPGHGGATLLHGLGRRHPVRLVQDERYPASHHDGSLYTTSPTNLTREDAPASVEHDARHPVVQSMLRDLRPAIFLTAVLLAGLPDTRALSG